MKLLGALLFIGVTSFIGFDLSQALHKRTTQLRDIIHSLQILEAEMGYSQLPLEMIFYSVSKKTKQPISNFYTNLANQLSGVVTDFIQIWEEEIIELQKIGSLQNNELDIMRQFGQSLGQHTFSQQQKQITLTIHHLQRELEEANDRRKKYEKMLKTLGVLIGLFVVLLLL